MSCIFWGVTQRLRACKRSQDFRGRGEDTSDTPHVNAIIYKSSPAEAAAHARPPSALRARRGSARRARSGAQEARAFAKARPRATQFRSPKVTPLRCTQYSYYNIKIDLGEILEFESCKLFNYTSSSNPSARSQKDLRCIFLCPVISLQS